MILIIIIAIYVLFNLAPKWILKSKYSRMENNFSWIIPILKLSGLVLSLTLAFLLLFGVTISSKDSFVENENAIYGLEFDSSFKELGFKDSMQIKSVNGNEVDRVSNILKTILISNGKVEVLTELNGVNQKIILDESDILNIMQNINPKSIAPILTNEGKRIKITTSNFGFSDVINRFRALWNQAFKLINPLSSMHGSNGGYLSISKITNYKGYFTITSFYLMILGIINLLPFPGFSLGNFIVSTIETIRQKHFHQKKKRMIEFTSIFLVIIFISVGVYM